MTTEGCWQNLVMASLRIRPGIARRLIRPRKAIGQQLVKLRLMTAVIVNGKSEVTGISSNAKWIWTPNSGDKEVWCQKDIGG